MEVCKMETSTVCKKLSDLAIELPGTPIGDRKIEMKYFTIGVGNFSTGGEIGYEVTAARKYITEADIDYKLYYSWNGYLACRPNSENAVNICKSFCGVKNLVKGTSCRITKIS